MSLHLSRERKKKKKKYVLGSVAVNRTDTLPPTRIAGKLGAHRPMIRSPKTVTDTLTDSDSLRQ